MLAPARIGVAERVAAVEAEDPLDQAEDIGRRRLLAGGAKQQRRCVRAPRSASGLLLEKGTQLVIGELGS